MKNKFLQCRRDCLNWTITKKNQLTTLSQKYGKRTLIILFFGALLYHKDVQIQIGVDNQPLAMMAANVAPQARQMSEKIVYADVNPTLPKVKKTVFEETKKASILPQSKGFWSSKTSETPTKSTLKSIKTKWNDDGTLANTYSNLTYTNPKFATKGTSSAAQKKRKKQLAYIDRFVKVAQTEMEKFGVPASITLAQGLLESNVGESRLSVRNNNHFGIKCFSRSCGKGHCSNFTDDSHKDFFRKYSSAWESYRAHSRMLGGNRYRKLKQLGTKDYKNWAIGLKKAGYATDKRYAEKLINLIEELELYRYDD